MGIDPLILPEFRWGRERDEVKFPSDPREITMVSRVLYMYEEAKKDRGRWDGVWKECWEFYIGKQWGPRPSWKASPVENYVFSKVETMLPILTDSRPRIHVLPQEPAYAEYAEVMQKLVSYLWDRLNMDEIVVQVTKNVLLFGKGFYYVYWDPDESDMRVESVDPQNIYVDKDATCIADARYLIHVGRMSKYEILKFWPEAEGKFGPGARTVHEPPEKEGISQSGDRSSYHDVTINRAYADPGVTATMVPWQKADLSDVNMDDEMVQTLQVWIRDPSVILEPAVDKKGLTYKTASGEELFLEKAKYPGGRHLIIAGNRIIHDDANPYRHGFFPYIEQDCHKVPGEFWSVGAVQNLISPQRELNKTLGQIIDNKNLMGNNQWVVSKNSGIKPDQITAKPGLVIEKNMGSEVERIEAKPLPSYITQFIDGRRQALDDISGVYDVTQGRKPSGITAGIAITTLQEAAQTRLRLLVRNLENAIKRQGDQWIGLAQQFYTQGKTIRITDPMTGQFQFVEVTADQIRRNWELIVVAGSTLPRSREVRQAQAVELFQLGVFDEETLLEYIDHPGRDRLMERIRRKKDMQFQMAMQGIDIDKAMQGDQGVVQ